MEWRDRPQALWHMDHCKIPFGRCVDIGAYHGEWSIEAVKRGADIVYAFEIKEKHFNGLKASITHAETDGAYQGLNKIEPFLLGVMGMQGQPDTISFVNLVRLLGPIDFMKIDIEGGEHEIFVDSHEMFNVVKHIGFLQLEIHPKPGHRGTYLKDIEQMISLLDIWGFKDRICEVREVHPGDFCSHNHYYSRGFVQMAV